MQQAWAVAFGLVDPDRSTTLMSRFLAHQPTWAQPASMALVDGELRAVGYWSPVGWALLRVGKVDLAADGARSIRAGADSAGWAWPFTSADAGELIVLESGAPPAAADPAITTSAKTRKRVRT
jgi:hypothetical protein